jgi:hypothetical protein
MVKFYGMCSLSALLSLKRMMIRSTLPVCQSTSRRVFSHVRAHLSTNAASGNSIPGHIIVVGGGAVGSLFAGRLGALKSHKGRVWMLSSWEEHMSVIKNLPGLIVQEEGTIGKECLIGSVRCANSAKEILTTLAGERGVDASSRVSTVLIAVKQSGIRKASQQAAELLAKFHGGLCVALLNGMGHMEIIMDAIRFNPPHCVQLNDQNYTTNYRRRYRISHLSNQQNRFVQCRI